jgi:phosphorylcholine metabolism protein LicD
MHLFNARRVRTHEQLISRGIGVMSSLHGVGQSTRLTNWKTKEYYYRKFKRNGEQEIKKINFYKSGECQIVRQTKHYICKTDK